jgi:hypothetical protein
LDWNLSSISVLEFDADPVEKGGIKDAGVKVTQERKV